jgi:molybdenum cofactor cytidylyltransferase
MDRKERAVHRPEQVFSGEKAAGIILAAGTSTRMKGLKQLLPFGETSLLGHIIHQACRSELDRVMLVLGHDADEIQRRLAPALKDPAIRVVINADYMRGMSSSIQTGLAAIENHYDNMMILLADMPHVTTRLINLLLKQYSESGLPLGAVQIKNRRTHPVVLNRKMYPFLHKLRGDIGARHVFDRFKDRICRVSPEWEYKDMDIDTPEDYEALVEKIRGPEDPRGRGFK